MKAVVITKSGSPEVLKVEEREIPISKNGQVLIKVFAAGVNRPDVMQRAGNYPPPKNAPQDIPGLELAGEIVACDEDVNYWKVGDKVCALVSGGAYAEYVIAEDNCCLPIPKGLDAHQAAALPETVFTVWYNVFMLGALKAQENFLVHGGSSGIGTTAIQLAKAIGANIYTTAGSVTKCDACIKLGAKQAINYKTHDFEKALNAKMDVILDMVGGTYFSKNINMLKTNGRLVYINAMEGRNVDLDILTLMQKRLKILGSTLRPQSKDEKGKIAKEVLKNVWPIIAEGKFKPVIYQTFKYNDADKAHTLMESSQHIGKILLTFD